MEIQLLLFFLCCVYVYVCMCINFPFVFSFFFPVEQKLNKQKNGNADVKKNHGKITIPNEYAIYCAHKFVDVSLYLYIYRKYLIHTYTGGRTSTHSVCIIIII